MVETDMNYDLICIGMALVDSIIKGLTRNLSLLQATGPLPGV